MKSQFTESIQSMAFGSGRVTVSSTDPVLYLP